jgi:Bacterial Ig-like domain (group 2)
MRDSFISRRGRGRRESPLVGRVVEILEARLLLADGISAQSGPQLNGTAGVALTNVEVASFTITDSSGEPGTKWEAHVAWGDGAEDKNVPVTAVSDVTFEFLDSHTYANPGTYTINVMIAVPGSHMPFDNVVMTTAVITSQAILQSIAVTPANPSVAAGATQQFTAIGTFSDNSTQDLTSQVSWTSDTPAVATIDATGLATGVTPGTANISATLNGVTGATVLAVTAPQQGTISGVVFNDIDGDGTQETRQGGRQGWVVRWP